MSAARSAVSPCCGGRACWATRSRTRLCRAWRSASWWGAASWVPLLIGAGIASWLSLRFVAALLATTRIKQDAALGIALASFFGAGIALLAYIQAIPDAGQAGLDHFIFGQAAAIIESDVRLVSAVGAAVLLVLALFWKEIKLLTFDPEFAGANGFRIGLLNTLLSTLIVATIVLGLQLAGVILMVGMLIAPGVAARQWTHKLDQMVILAAVFGAFSGGVGAVVSALDSDIPTGPMIIVAAFALVLISLAFAPGRGLVWSRLRARANRRAFAARNTLRDLYRYALAHGASDSAVPDAFIRGVGGRGVALGLSELRAAGQATLGAGGWRLSPGGIELARRDRRNQQLWDLYRLHADELGLPLAQVDRQVDIAARLPPAALAKLESLLPEGADA